jgi:hypothetical protein
MKKIILFTLVILGWLTIVIRLNLRIVESDFSILESTIQFFSFFTILLYRQIGQKKNYC